MRLRTRLGLALLAVVLILGVLAWTFRWHRLDSVPGVTMSALPVPILSYGDLAEQGNERVTVRLRRGTGELLYIGTHHTRDPDDPQVEEIRRSWNTFRPTVALVESRLGFYVGGLKLGVGMFGEAGAVLALGRGHDVPVYTLEAPLDDEMRAVLTTWRADRVAMFYVLRGSLSRGRAEDREREAAQLIPTRTRWPGLEGSLRDVAHLDSLYRSELPELPDWRVAGGTILWPGRTESYLNEIATTVNRFRDEYMVNLLRELLDRGDRVFAVVGNSHVVMQEPALHAMATATGLDAARR